MCHHIKDKVMKIKSNNLNAMWRRMWATSLIAMLCTVMVCGQTRERVIYGVVKNSKNNRALANVNIMVEGENVGTVTNEDGAFSLKLSEQEGGIVVSHLSFQNRYISPLQIKQANGILMILLDPASVELKEVNVYGGDPRDLVAKAIERIPQNYAEEKHLFSAFYRETIQKRRHYIEISEAFMDVYKTGYGWRNIASDRVRIQKGRRLASQKTSDTLAVKISGGPNLSLFLDVVKNKEELLSREEMDFYDFAMESHEMIDDRMQYVVRFYPRVKQEYALYEGVLYIDQESLAVTRAEFELDMSDQNKAVDFILRNKPLGLRFKPARMAFVVAYKQQNGRSYLNYVGSELRFKCDWKKRLFSSTFTVKSEMVMVDRTDNPAVVIKGKDSFRQKQILNYVVDQYWSPEFWSEYNIIEPSESLESGVKKLKKK